MLSCFAEDLILDSLATTAYSQQYMQTIGAEMGNRAHLAKIVVMVLHPLVNCNAVG
jgi:hypothetical protein